MDVAPAGLIYRPDTERIESFEPFVTSPNVLVGR
jgi:hypothetical protein